MPLPDGTLLGSAVRKVEGRPDLSADIAELQRVLARRHAASALRRAGLRGEREAVARVGDTISVTSTLRGKVEFESGEEGRETEVLAHLLRVASRGRWRSGRRC